MLGNLDTNSEIQKYLKELQQIKDPFLLGTVIDALLKHEQAIEPDKWDVVKASPYNWYILLSDLISNGTDYVIPPDLLDQESVVKCHLEYDLEGLMGNYEDYIILDKREFEWQGTTLINYLVSLEVKSTESTYLAIVSQPVDSEDVHLYPIVSKYSAKGLTKENLEEYYQKTLQEWISQQ